MVANRVVNTAGIAAAVAASGSGLAMAIGPGRKKNEETPGLLGLSRESWLELHESAVAAFLCAVLVHIILHGRQVVSMCKQAIRSPKRLVKDPAVFLMVIAVLLLTAGAMPDEAEAEPGDDCKSGYVMESIAAYSHFAAGAAAVVVLSLHVSRRRGRIIRAAVKEGEPQVAK
jgi:hypothetical protein